MQNWTMLIKITYMSVRFFQCHIWNSNARIAFMCIAMNHSRSQRPCSFWSTQRIATSERIQFFYFAQSNRFIFHIHMNIMQPLEFQMANYGSILYITQSNSASVRELYFPRWNRYSMIGQYKIRIADCGLWTGYKARTRV